MKYKSGGEWHGVSYTQFGDETENFALGLATLGAKRGDKISIISENRPEWV